MSILTSTRNVFDLSGPSPHLQDCYNAENVGKTREELKQHFGSGLYDKVSSMIATEINTYNSPAAQTMMDVYHHWSLHSKQNKTWNDFINNTSLSHLRRDNMNIFSPFQDYQHQYTSNVYAPLSQYNGNAFKGNASDLVQKLSDVYNHLKLRKTTENCCLQVDARFTVNKQTENSSSVHSNSMQINHFNDDEDESSDDDDDEYAIEYAQNLPSKYNFPPKKQAVKMNDFSAASKPESKPESNISKYAKMETNDLSRTEIDNVMRKSMHMDSLHAEPYSYKRYEMLFDRDIYGHINSDMVTTFEAVSNKTLPSCSFRNSPLCRIWNSTESTQEIINHLNVMDLLTFSYQLLNDCIQIYMFIASGDKLYGSRIFREDLLTTIPSLFENKSIDKHTLEELDSYLEFKDDKIYNKYKEILFKRNVDDLKEDLEDELSDTLRSQLEEIVYSWNNRNSRSRQMDLDQITDIFIKHKINSAYFENTHRTKFVKLFQRNRIKTCIANQLWLDFGGHLSDDTECKSCMDEKSDSQSISTNSTNITILCDPSPIQLYQIQQSQIHDLQNQGTQKDETIVRLLQCIQTQKQKLKDQKQEIYELRRGRQYFVIDDYKQNDNDNLSNGSSTDGSSHLDHILNGCNSALYVFRFNVASSQSSLTQSDTSNDPNFEQTPETVYAEVESDMDQHDAARIHNDRQHNNDNNQNEDIQSIQSVINRSIHIAAPNDTVQQQQEAIDADDIDGGIYDDDDDDDDDENEQKTSTQHINDVIRPFQPQYDKWEMINNPYDAGYRFLHERQQRLNGQINGTEHRLRANINTQTVMGLFQNAFQAYYVISVYLISVKGVQNLYCMINNKWNDLNKKSDTEQNK